MKAKIVNMNKKRSITHPNMEYPRVFAIYVDDYGFLSLDGKNVYTPCGGTKALKELLASGLDQPGYSFVYP